jgi:hypothetical protein
MTKYTIGVATLDGGYEIDCSQKDTDDINAGYARYAEYVEELKKTQYQRDRKAEYDKLNQFEMQFDDQRDGTTTWVDAINGIKDKYPKE